MKTQDGDRPKKKRATKRILKELYKDAQESCDRLLQELDKPFVRHKELLVQEEKNT